MPMPVMPVALEVRAICDGAGVPAGGVGADAGPDVAEGAGMGAGVEALEVFPVAGTGVPEALRFAPI